MNHSKNSKTDWFLLGFACIFLGLSWTGMSVYMMIEFHRFGGSGLAVPYRVLDIMLCIIPLIGGFMCLGRGFRRKS